MHREIGMHGMHERCAGKGVQTVHKGLPEVAGAAGNRPPAPLNAEYRYCS